MFISKAFVDKHQLEVTPATGTIKDGGGKKLVERIGTVKITVRNGVKSVACSPDIMVMPPRRDLVIGLSHFALFGYELRGVPVKQPEDSDEEEKSENKHEKTDLVDGLTAGELHASVEDALGRNTEIPLSQRCTHELAILLLKPTSTEQIWKRINYVSKRDEPKVDEKVASWEEAGVIERAPETCKNAFPLLCVPKKDAYGNKVDVRPCLDLRQLNQRLPDVNYPLPKIRDIITQVGSL